MKILQLNNPLVKIYTNTRFELKNDLQRALYIAAQNAESDRVSMSGASRRAGIREGVFQTARNMKQKHLDSNVISEITGLSFEEIEAL